MLARRDATKKAERKNLFTENHKNSFQRAWLWIYRRRLHIDCVRPRGGNSLYFRSNDQSATQNRRRRRRRRRRHNQICWHTRTRMHTHICIHSVGAAVFIHIEDLYKLHVVGTTHNRHTGWQRDDIPKATKKKKKTEDRTNGSWKKRIKWLNDCQIVFDFMSKDIPRR